MPKITYDSQSFMVGGRRIWLVSGAIHYTRTPHQLWRSRIRAAKQAGLNCIETPVFWNVHEPQPGRFRFEGDCDLRAFVQIIGEEGLHCILRPGPYVNGQWDFGGLPAWLLQEDDIAFRQANTVYLRAVARYLAAVMKQVRDLQVTSSPPGPVMLVQNENEWFCHNDEQAEGYLEEISRFLRENGCEVPLINANNLWQPVANTIDCWTGRNDLLRDCRQLRIVGPEAPRLVVQLATGWFDSWGRPHHDETIAHDLLRTLAQTSAAGAQFNLHPFHGGTNFGFHGGRSIGSPDTFVTTSYDFDAPLAEGGGRTEKYHAVKRICTFLNRFGALMANLRAAEHHTVALPDAEAPTHTSVMQQSGSQGDVVFLIRQSHAKPQTVRLLTPDGQTLPVHMGHDSAAWIVLNANLGGIATLNATNLRPWAFVQRKMLVLFGPAGSEALVSINGAVLRETVPTDHDPLVKQHEHLTVVIVSDRQIDTAYLHDDGRLFIGIGGFDEQGNPIRDESRRAGTAVIVHVNGEMQKQRLDPAPRIPSRPKLINWERADLHNYVEGSAPRFAAIDGPRSLEACGADFGYGWYRVRFNLKKGIRANLLIPESADRLHLYQDGVLKQIIGVGPGAEDEPVKITMRAGHSDLVFLADNMGRLAFGTGYGERKGIFGHLLSVKPMSLGKADVEVSPIVDPFSVSGMVLHAASGDRSLRKRYSFSINNRRKMPVAMVLRGHRPRSVLLVNDQPIAVDAAEGTTWRFVLEHRRHLRKGGNTITFACIDPTPEHYDLRKALDAFEVIDILSAEAQWSYARWQPPDDSHFHPMPARTPAAPAWYRARFKVEAADPGAPGLWLEVHGLSKGQIYLNDRNVGRYFVGTQTGKKVLPQSRYYLPEPWLNVGQDNELLIFDEHGKLPTKCKLIYDAAGPYPRPRK